MGYKKHILVIEDDDHTRQQVKDLLHEVGYRVSSVANHRIAIEMLKLHHRSIDMIFSDVDTDDRATHQECSGLTFLRNQQNRGIPTVLWTGDPDLQLSEDLGCIAHIEKGTFGLRVGDPFIPPHNIPLFLEFIESCVEKASQAARTVR